MAIKKMKSTVEEPAAAPQSQPAPDSQKMPNFDHTEFNPEDLMDQAVRDSKGSGFEKLPTGNWVGIVNKIDTWRSEKGFFYRIHLVCNVDDNPTFRHIIWCHILLDDNRTFHEWGPTFYARHMAALGYSKTDDQKRVRDEVNEAQPGVIVSSVPNRKNPEWNDVSIRDRLGDDNAEIQKIRTALENEPY